VEKGQQVSAGQQLTEGAKNPKEVLRIQGREATAMYILNEVQKVYRSQGVGIHDKYIEIVLRQMLRRVVIKSSGDSEFLPGEVVDHFALRHVNDAIIAQGGEPAHFDYTLMGITKASLNTESFLAAASFQETTRVLTDAAVRGAVDHLRGLKENVIIGKLIPVGTGLKARMDAAARRKAIEEEAEREAQGEIETLDALIGEELSPEKMAELDELGMPVGIDAASVELDDLLSDESGMSLEGDLDDLLNA
jgi:DNA-directed RNA polymerase subunit beta'